MSINVYFTEEQRLAAVGIGLLLADFFPRTLERWSRNEGMTREEMAVRLTKSKAMLNGQHEIIEGHHPTVIKLGIDYAFRGNRDVTLGATYKGIR